MKSRPSTKDAVLHGRPDALSLARHVIAREAEHTTTGEGEPSPTSPTSAHSACKRLHHQLTTWFGPSGCSGLFARALADARAEHPALAGVELRAESDAVLEGVDESARNHGPEAVAAGLQSLLVSLFEVLIRLIGDDLAAQILLHDPQPNDRPEPDRINDQTTPTQEHDPRDE